MASKGKLDTGLMTTQSLWGMLDRELCELIQELQGYPGLRNSLYAARRAMQCQLTLRSRWDWDQLNLFDAGPDAMIGPRP